MINEIFLMNGYGLYVWSAFFFTLINFVVLYFVINLELSKEKNKFKSKFKNLAYGQVQSAKKQSTYREILANTPISEI